MCLVNRLRVRSSNSDLPLLCYGNSSDSNIDAQSWINRAFVIRVQLRDSTFTERPAHFIPGNWTLIMCLHDIFLEAKDQSRIRAEKFAVHEGKGPHATRDVTALNPRVSRDASISASHRRDVTAAGAMASSRCRRKGRRVADDPHIPAARIFKTIQQLARQRGGKRGEVPAGRVGRTKSKNNQICIDAE